mgnify:CR=1 FL=1
MEIGLRTATATGYGSRPGDGPGSEDEPWGFAPFHYGRWAFVDSSWCWVPGPRGVRPVYAPALVAFVGGGGFHLALGWEKASPGSRSDRGKSMCRPYRVSRGYVNNVNATNTRVNVTQVHECLQHVHQ